MATGSGKTVVMAMIIAYNTLDKIRNEAKFGINEKVASLLKAFIFRNATLTPFG